MTTWKDGGDYGTLYREIVSEDGSRAICRVKIRQLPYHAKSMDRKHTSPYSQGEEDYRLILQAPQMLEALNTIAKGAIVSSDQAPERIAEQTLRVLQLVREENLKYLLHISTQQKRAERAEAALESIRDMAECFLQPLPVGCAAQVRWTRVRDQAVKAIAMTQGGSDEDELV